MGNFENQQGKKITTQYVDTYFFEICCSNRMSFDELQKNKGIFRATTENN